MYISIEKTICFVYVIIMSSLFFWWIIQSGSYERKWFGFDYGNAENLDLLDWDQRLRKLNYDLFLQKI
ncbi:hypothetical protein VNO77_36081 [Canavalia gladiata]|uniref:Uncharacterized protein n=1 Tax=Canavalia gladiata TaxID=3824 RepID=A0AAN9K9C3_CANGL